MIRGKVIFMIVKILKTFILMTIVMTLLLTSNVYAEINTGGSQKDTLYIVQLGDTLEDIGDRYNLAFQIIAFYNNIKDPNILYEGQELYIPHNINDLSNRFINDPALIGQWETVDFVIRISDFIPGEKQWEEGLLVKSMLFADQGVLYMNDYSPRPWFAWTKGLILHKNSPSLTTYEIKEMDGTKYLFYKWGRGETGFYVLKFIARLDNIELDFVNDPKILGVWKTVDIVSEPSEFETGVKKYEGDFVNTEFKFLKKGKAITGKNPWLSWTKGFVIHSRLQVANRYSIQEIDGARYMFLEWKTGDYVFRNAEPLYYVLKYEGT